MSPRRSARQRRPVIPFEDSPVVSSTTRTRSKPATNSTTKSAFKSASKPTTNPVSNPVSNPASNPVSNPASNPASKTAVNSDLEYVANGITRSLAHLRLQPSVEDALEEPNATEKALTAWTKDELKDLKSYEILEIMPQPETVIFKHFDPGYIHESIPCIPDNIDSTDVLALFDLFIPPELDEVIAVNY
jgi:hypothetical protein